MLRLLRQSDRQPVTLRTDPPLGAGGEARVYELQNDTRLVAKIYHHPTDATARKLAAMLANPPDESERQKAKGESREQETQNTQHPTPEHPKPTPYSLLPTPCLLAWPTDLLLTPDSLHRVVGFLMPRVSDRRPLFTYYNPAARRQFGPLSNPRYLHRTGRNLAAAFRALHTAGCVIGDVNETNILASETALVTLIDCDSFQVRDPHTGTLYRCPVGRPEFTPPELLSADFAHADRTPEHDRFGLAVLLFQLLLEGTHPFAGIYAGKGDPPPYDTRIQSGHFVYGTHRVPYRPMPAAPPIEILHPALRQLFLRAFEDGHDNPAARPDANTWLNALEAAETALLTCEVNTQHLYGNHLPACPWCERTRQLGGRDPFPSLHDVRTGKHQTPAPRRHTSDEGKREEGTGKSGSPTSTWSYSAPTTHTLHPTPSPLPAAPQNFWALAAWALLTAALLPPFRFFVGGALICGAVGIRAAFRSAVGGKLSALSATFAGLMLAFFSFLPALLPRNPAATRTLGGFDGAIQTLAFSPDGKTVAAGMLRPATMSGTRGALFLLDTRAENSEVLSNFRGDVNAVAFSPDGKTLAVGFIEPLGEGHLQLWNPRNKTRTWEKIAHRDAIRAVAFSPDGKTVVSGGFYDYVREKRLIAEISLWDSDSGSLLKTLQSDGEVNGVAFSPDGKTLVVGTGGGSSGRSTEAGHVTLWNVASEKPVWSRVAHSTTALAVAFSPDGKTVASAGNDNAVKLWDAKTGTLNRTLEGGGFWISAVAFSPDGKTVAGGGNDAIVRLWETTTGKLTRSLSGHEGVVQALSFSPDGRTLASGSRDGAVKIWRLSAANP